MAATYEDGKLVVQLMRWGTELGLQDALRVVFSEGFDPETVPDDDGSVSKALFFGETVGTLVKHGLLDRGLVTDLLYFEGIWNQVGPSARRARERSGVEALYENFEALVSSPAG